MRPEQSFRLQPELARVIGQGRHIIEFEIKRLDAGGEGRGRALVRNVHPRAADPQVPDVHTRQAFSLGLRLLALQGVEQGCPVQATVLALDKAGLEAVEPDFVKNQGALGETGCRQIDEQFAKFRQCRAGRVDQAQFAQTQAQGQRVEFGPCQRQTVPGFFGDEFFGLRLNDPRQRQPGKGEYAKNGADAYQRWSFQTLQQRAHVGRGIYWIRVQRESYPVGGAGRARRHGALPNSCTRKSTIALTFGARLRPPG